MSDDHPHKDDSYVSGDGYNYSAPWRLADYFREGPLTNEQVADLATRFDLDPDNIRRLSRALNIALNRESGIDLVPMRHSTAKARGQERMSKALRDIVVAQERLTAGLNRLKGLCIEDHVNSVGMWRIHDALRDCQQLLRDVPAELETTAKSPGGIMVLEPTDKRTIVDRRRDMVLMTIYHVWTKAGRRLSYTTDTQTSERRGLLIEFANAVVACVTNPPSALSGEMIVKEIGAFRRRNEAASVSTRFSDADWDTWTAFVPSFRVTISPVDPADSLTTSTRHESDEWITPVHTWGRMFDRKRRERDGAPDQETNDDPNDQTEPAPRGGPRVADRHGGGRA